MSRPDPQTLVEEAQAPPTYRNPAAEEMREQDFQQWRHHPITQCFLLFLAHRSQALGRDALVHYIAGALEHAEKAGLRGRIMELEELCSLKASDIHGFYGVAPEAKQPESQS